MRLTDVGPCVYLVHNSLRLTGRREKFQVLANCIVKTNEKRPVLVLASHNKIFVPFLPFEFTVIANQCQHFLKVKKISSTL